MMSAIKNPITVLSSILVVMSFIAVSPTVMSAERKKANTSTVRRKRMKAGTDTSKTGKVNRVRALEPTSVEYPNLTVRTEEASKNEVAVESRGKRRKNVRGEESSNEGASGARSREAANVETPNLPVVGPPVAKKEMTIVKRGKLRRRRPDGFFLPEVGDEVLAVKPAPRTPRSVSRKPR